MNPKNITIALIAALTYEILLKTMHLILPRSLTNFPPPVIGMAITLVIFCIIILFLFSFAQQAKNNSELRTTLYLLVVCLLLSAMFRLIRPGGGSGYQHLRLLGHIVGLLQSILLVAMMAFYQRQISSGSRALQNAAVLVIALFAAGVIKSALELVDYLRFVHRGIMTDYPPAFYMAIFILFLLTHAAMIGFLCCYYKTVSTA